MTGEPEALRSSRTVIVAIVAAALAVTAFSLVGIAVLMGWIPRGGVTSPTSIASPAQQVTGTAPAVEPPPQDPAMAPIETSKRPEPLMPRYSQPTPPPPAPVEAPPRTQPMATAAPRKADARPPQYDREPVERAVAQPRPVEPAYARTQPQRLPAPARESAPAGGDCDHCGTVSTITTYPGLWEVRVRFEDGASRTFRFRSRPPFGVGERVRLEDGMLLHD